MSTSSVVCCTFLTWARRGLHCVRVSVVFYFFWAPDSPRSWVVLEYDGSGKALVVKASGEGGMSEFKAGLGEGAAWGGFKCVAVDNRQNTTSKRTKIVFVQFMPDSAPAMRRAKVRVGAWCVNWEPTAMQFVDAERCHDVRVCVCCVFIWRASTPLACSQMGSQKGAVKQVMHSAHLDLTVTEPAEIEETDLVSRLQAATGAHKPNGYEFEPGVVTSAEGFLNG